VLQLRECFVRLCGHHFIVKEAGAKNGL
jgi:hypothetical protein